MQSYKQAAKFKAKEQKPKQVNVSNVRRSKVKKAVVVVTGHKDSPKLSGIAKDQPYSVELLAHQIKNGSEVDEVKRKLQAFDFVALTYNQPNESVISQLKKLAKLRNYNFLRVNIKEQKPVSKEQAEEVKEIIDIPVKPKRKYVHKIAVAGDPLKTTTVVPGVKINADGKIKTVKKQAKDLPHPI